MFSNTILIIINIIISIIIIYGTHLFWHYLKETYSKKKTNDLVNTQIEKYKKMIGEIQQQQQQNMNSGSQQIEFISENDIANMDNDLTEYLQNELTA